MEWLEKNWKPLVAGAVIGVGLAAFTKVGPTVKGWFAKAKAAAS